MATTVHTISVLVNGNTSGLGAALTSGSSAFLAFRSTAVSSLSSVRTAFNSLSTGTQTFLKVGAGIALLTAGFKAVVGPAIEFESAFAGVRKTVDATPEQFDRIRRGLVDMSKVMPATAEELALIAEKAGQVGVAAPEILRFTEVIAQLGETTDLNFDEASISLARFTTVSGDGARDAARVSDALVDLGNNFAATEREIIDFSQRMASSLTIAGVAQDEILGLAAGFRSLGLRAEAGGTAANRIFTSLAEAARTGGDDLQTYAQVAGEIPPVFQQLIKDDPTEAFFRVAEGLQRMRERGEPITPFLESLNLAGIRTGEVFRVAALGVDLLRDSVERAGDNFENAGARQTEYDRRVETTASRLEILQNRIRAVRIEVGTPLLDTLVAGIDAAGDAVASLVQILSPLGSTLFETFSNLAQAASFFFDTLGSPALRLAVAALGGLATVANALLSSLNALGPAGILIAALAADLALVGPVSRVAVSALGALGITVKAVALNTRGAATSMNLFAVATSTAVAEMGKFGLLRAGLGLGLITLALVQVGRGMADFSKASSDASSDLQEFIETARGAGEFEDLSARLGQVSERITELEGMDTVSDDLDLSLGNLWESAQNVFSLFRGDTGFLKARGEAEGLRDALEETGFENYNRNLGILSEMLGLSVPATAAMADELGLLEDIAGPAADGLYRGFVALSSFKEASEQATGATTDLQSKVYAGTAGMQDYADELGITVEQLFILAGQIDDIDLDLLAKPGDDPVAAMEEFGKLFLLLNGRLSETAAALDITTGELIDQIGATDALARAHDRLVAAIERSRDVQQQLTFIQDFFAEASANAATALENLNAGAKDGGAALRTYADAQAELARASAATATSEDQVRQVLRDLRAEFVRNALEAGYSAAAIREFGASFLGIPEEFFIDIFLESKDAQTALEAVKDGLSELDRQLLIDIGIIDEATPEIEAVLEVLKFYGEEGQWLAVLLADGKLAEEEALAVQRVLGDTVDDDYLAFLRLNTDGFTEPATGAQQQRDNLDGSEAQVTIAAETSRFDGPITLAKAQLTDVTAQQWVAQFDADTQEAVAKMAGVELQALEWDDLLAIADLDANGVLALEELETVLSAIELGFDRRIFEAILQANTEDADSKLESLNQAAQDFDAKTFQALFDADAQLALETITKTFGRALEWDDLLAIADLNADGQLAENEISALRILLDQYDLLAPVADLDGDGTLAEAEIRRIMVLLDAIENSRPVADIDADGSFADAEYRRMRAQGDAWENRSDTADLRVNASQAYGEFQRALGYLNSFRSKTITLVTRHRVVGGSSGGSTITRSENGGIVSPIRSFQSGGFLDYLDDEEYRRYVREYARGPRIYRAVSPGRLFAEPATQDEAYIPLGPGKRDQALDVFFETGRRLGVFKTSQRFQDGGILSQQRIPPSGSVAINQAPTVLTANVTINVPEGSRVDSQEVARLANQEVQRALSTLGSQISNRRLV